MFIRPLKKAGTGTKNTLSHFYLASKKLINSNQTIKYEQNADLFLFYLTRGLIDILRDVSGK